MADGGGFGGAPPAGGGGGFGFGSKSLYVGNLPYKYTEKEVRDLFGPHGTIKDIRLRDGFCFLEYENDRDGDAAIEAHNCKTEMGGRMIRVEWSKGRGAGPRRSPPRRRYRSRSRSYSRSRSRSRGRRSRSRSRGRRSRSPRRSRSRSPVKRGRSRSRSRSRDRR